MTALKTISATLRLFKAVPITKKTKKTPSNDITRETLECGFVFSPLVAGNYTHDELHSLVGRASRDIGLSPKQANASFHKSWQKVRDAPYLQLFLEQITHYWTTYGYEYFGVYDQDSVYIPHEKLNIPDLKENIRLTVINGYTNNEFKTKLMNLLGSGIALKDETIDDVVVVATEVNFDKSNVENVKNKEVRVRLLDKMKIIPDNPTEFLRLLLYKTTDCTLIIKNDDTIEKIKSNCNNVQIKNMFILYTNYNDQEKLAKLSSIFYRYKPLFLAFRNDPEIRPYINKLRRLARTHHKPMHDDYLNTVTAQIKKGTFKRSELQAELKKANTFRKIRLAYALKFRLQDAKSVLYRVRNGKGWATSFSFDNDNSKSAYHLKIAYQMVITSILCDIIPNVKGKKIYIPDFIVYALPSTEKMFTGDFPSGTCVSVDDDVLVGVHWFNVDTRTDLDLSMFDVKGAKLGWNGRYRNDDNHMLFSGDMTDAPPPDGASELFYVRKGNKATSIMMLNNFNRCDVSVPYKLMVAHEKRLTQLPRNYMVNPNTMLSVSRCNISENQKILGFIDTTESGNKFYFAETGIGKTNVSSNNEYTKQSREFLLNYYRNAISLNEILEMAGAKLVKKKDNCDIDLSPESLEKDKIIGLLTKKG